MLLCRHVNLMPEVFTYLTVAQVGPKMENVSVLRVLSSSRCIVSTVKSLYSIVTGVSGVTTYRSHNLRYNY